MALPLRKTGRFVLRSILALCALFFIAVIAAQILLTLVINVVSTGRGTDFFEGQINQALAGSGYQVAFEALYYDPVRGFTLHDLSVADTQGPFLALDRFSLSVSFALGALRTLDLSAHGGTLALNRLPVSAVRDEPETQEGLKPFETPDIYFRKIVLSDLSFERIVLGERVAGSSYEFSPSLQARAALDDTITLRLTFEPGFPELAPNLSAPETIDVAAAVTPATLAFTLESFSVKASSYALSVQGAGMLGDHGMLKLRAAASHNALEALTENALKEARAQIVIDGPLSGPTLDLSALIVPENMKERGLSDISVILKTEDILQGMKGRARVETRFRDDPVTLESLLSYEENLLRITDIKGSAPALTLTGDGAFSTESNLFDGDLSLKADDLARYGELAAITLAGKLEAGATFKASAKQEQSASFSAKIADGAFDGANVKSLSAHATLDNVSTPWPQSAKLDLEGLRLNDGAVVLDALNAAVTQAAGESYKLTLNGRGSAPVALSFDGSAMLSELTQAVPSARDIALTIRHGDSPVKLSGSFTPERVDLNLSAAGLRGGDLPAELPAQLSDLRIDLDAAMTGTPAQPRTDVTAKLNGIGAAAYPDASVNVKAQHDGQKLSASITGQGTGLRKLDADAAFPMTLSLLPFHFGLEQAAPLSGTIAADIDLAAITPLLLPPTQSLSGRLVADGAIAGTLNAPSPSATLRLNGAGFEDDSSGILIADLEGAANVTRESLTLTSLSATDGKAGKLSGGGSLSFGDGATDIALQMRDFNAPRTNFANGIVGADLSLTGSQGGFNLSGTVDIAEMNVIIPEKFNSSIPQLNIVKDEKADGPNALKRFTLDIKIEAHNQVFVRGWGLDAEFGGNIAVSGTAAAPQFNGTLSSRRGRFEEFGKRFTLARANLRFQGAIPPSPYLDIEATTPAGDVTGSIIFTGPAQAPSIKFASTPALPEDEVLSRILFGKDSAKISPFQAVQLAQAIRRFSGQGGGGPGLDPLGMLRSATGLDDISIETDESGGANVDVGKYLTDKVYLEFSKGKAENSGEATIQIEVTPSINVESRIGQDAQGGGGIFWKRDY